FPPRSRVGRTRNRDRSPRRGGSAGRRLSPSPLLDVVLSTLLPVVGPVGVTLSFQDRLGDQLFQDVVDGPGDARPVSNFASAHRPIHCLHELPDLLGLCPQAWRILADGLDFAFEFPFTLFRFLTPPALLEVLLFGFLALRVRSLPLPDCFVTLLVCLL